MKLLLSDLISPERQKKQHQLCKDWVETVQKEPGLMRDMALKLIYAMEHPKSLAMMPEGFLHGVLLLASVQLTETVIEIEKQNIAESN